MEPFRTVRQASGSYPVWVGRGLFGRLGELIEGLGRFGGVALLLAEGIEQYWGEAITSGLGDRPTVIAFPDSETQKDLANVDRIVTSLLENGARRDWLAIVAGGGSAGDTGGLAASLFMRGIPYVHVPTTLLAQVDSSLGGKLAVNHVAGKNLIGVFAAPRAVISDLDALSTLPARELRSGLYEALKGGILGDERLFELMEGQGAESYTDGVLEEVVTRAIDVKIEIVSADEREGDRRRLLNYGHTIGHGIEAATGYAGLTHGDAVAWGMIAANAIALERGLVSSRFVDRVERAIMALGPDPLPGLGVGQILESVAHDKKFRHDRQVMVLPVEIGRCEVFEDISGEELRSGAEAAIAASRGYEARA